MSPGSTNKSAVQEETHLLAVRVFHAKSALRKYPQRTKVVKCKQGFRALLPHRLKSAAELRLQSQQPFLLFFPSAEIVSWDPKGNDRAQTHSQSIAGDQMYLQRSSWDPQYLPLGLWGWAGELAHGFFFFCAYHQSQSPLK